MIYNDRTLQPSMQTEIPSNRQANPDIQDIITGIVKLLNGNVNVAVNTLRPHKPVQATRINNRGPPRISDLPPLPPDFDTPGMNPPPLPPQEHPYPFETPPPERPSINQLPPTPDRSPARPPNLRPWNRPNRRPIPPYKPLPPQESNFFFDKDDKIHRNNATTQSIHENPTEPTENPTEKPQRFQPPLKPERIDPASTLVLGAELQPIPIPSQSEPNNSSSIFPSETTRKKMRDSSSNPSTSATISTLKIETSSSIQVIEPTRTIIEIQPSIVPLESNTEASSSIKPTLEPSKSIQDSFASSTDYETHKSTPTKGLVNTMSSKSSGIVEASSSVSPSFYKPSMNANTHAYHPRPGIVLDDTLDYTKKQTFATQRPHLPPRHHQIGDIFDVTVSVIQGPGGSSGEGVRIPVNPHGGSGEDVILTSAVEGQGFVSIDGKRTHLNLFDNTPETISPTKAVFPPARTQPPVFGTGYAVPQPDIPVPGHTYRGTTGRPVFRKTTTDIVRIDTCIVGDSSTCDSSQHEACATVQGVSACQCKPGFARIIRTLPCKRVISIVVSIRVDRIYDKEVVWNNSLLDKNSESYQEIAYESNVAIESAMSMTPYTDEYMGSSINGIYQGDVSQGQGGVFVNATIKLTYEARTARNSLSADLQKQLLGVIHRRNNNIGKSAVFVKTPAGSISNLQDLDECASTELNDCHSSAVCNNVWGGFVCACKAGLKDPHSENPDKAGRVCLSCPASHCNNRGSCSYQGNVEHCTCAGNYYGVKCEIDGEVVAVAIGASVAALIIIILTLVCLVMWSRRWSREQKAMGSPVYGYMQGGMPGTMPNTLARVGSMGTLASVKQGPPSNMPPYMWGHLADHMATANLYGGEPMGPTRPSSAVFGYPTMSVHGTLPPVPLPRLQAPPRTRQRHLPEPDSSDSEPQDKDRADLIPQSSGFHVPRPKSRSSLANQSGIYYDVEYDQGDAHHLSKNNIPMSTYSMARPYYRT
uniref:SP63_1 protein n=1 Tax=Fopius arisanus TaxID=64838 RepID=A0A0C9PKG3_9HYME